MKELNVKGYHLSRQQARLYRLQGEGQMWYAQCVVQLSGKLNMSSLLSALQRLVEQHDILRMTLQHLSGMEIPVQVVTDHVDVSCPLLNLEHLSAADQARYLDEQFTRLQLQIAQSETQSLFAVALLQFSPQVHMLLLCLPTLCADEYTLLRIVAELSQMYAEPGADIYQDEEPLQYADVAAWLEELLEAEDAETLRTSWPQITTSELAATPLPFAQRSATKNVTINGKREKVPVYATHEMTLTANFSAHIQRRAREYDTSVEAWLLACWEVVLWRLSSKQTSLLGVVSDGRMYEDLTQELKRALGFYTRVVPLTVRIDADMPFEQIVRAVNISFTEAIQQQVYFTWEDVIVDDAGSPDASLPFFPLCFEYVEWPVPNQTDPLQFSLYKSSCSADPFALKLRVVQVAERLQLHFQYNPDAIATTQLERLASSFYALLQHSLARPWAVASALSLLDAASQADLLASGCAPDQALPTQVLHRLFEAQVQRQPNALAVISRQEQFTYQQLNARANQLARALLRRGIGPNVLVGLCLSRQATMLVGLLGVLKAGGAYLPLDASSPQARLQHQLQESGAQLLLTQNAERDSIPEWGGSTLYLEELADELAHLSEQDLTEESLLTDLAYVIYTSGSTGTPKGVMISQRNVVNYVLGICAQLKVEAGWQYATVSTLAADLGNTAIFTALATGGCVQVLTYEQVTSAQAMAEWTREHPIDVLKIVPSHLSALLEGDLGHNLLPRRALVLGGEALASRLLERIAELGATCAVYNHYGPTETTIGVLVNALGVPQSNTLIEKRQAIALGYPLTNTQVYVLDEHMRMVPRSITGELFVGGAGVAWGYIGQGALTAERFLPDPYSKREGARMYRTGDLVRYEEGGQIEFLGRNDGQVKLRGYRIEIGEIEAILRQHPLVWDCVVLLQETTPGSPRLIAYIVSRTATKFVSETLREALRASVPEYMVPSHFIIIKALPLTANGKVDRQRLPALEETSAGEPIVQDEPHSPIEEMLVQMWREMLAIPVISIHDNFFAVGGHSLLATRMIARLQTIFSVPLPVQMLFEAPTIASLALHIEQAVRQSAGLDVPPLVAEVRPAVIPLSFAQQRLWFLDHLEPGSTTYLVPHALHFAGNVDLAALERSVQSLIQRHESLRTTFALHEEQLIQVIHPAGHVILPVVDLQGLQTHHRSEEVRRLMSQEAQHPCDLSQGPLLRLWLLRLAQSEQVVLLTLHHIITDGWSNTIFVRELTALYRAYITGRPSPLAPLALQYADYALWQRQWLQGEVLERQLAYWRTQLAGVSPLVLPTDHPRPAVQTYKGASQKWQLPTALVDGLRTLSQQQQVTQFMTLLATFQVLLLRYSGQNDISVGTPIANRGQAEIEELIGFFVNTLVLRTDLSGNPSFVELLQRVRAVCLGAYTHQDVPFEQVVDALEPERDLSRSPLFQVMLTLQNVSQEPQVGLPGVQVRSLEAEQTNSKFDLTLVMTETEHGLHATLEYSTALFEAETIDRLLEHWQILLEGVIENPQARLSELPFLTAGEREHLLGKWNTTWMDVPQELSVHQLFEQQVQRTPDAVALVFGEETLTYSALNGRANQLAHYLRRLGIGPDNLVGLYMDRSIEMVVGLLGVLKAGGAYVPLDISTPYERLLVLLEDIKASAFLTREDLRGSLSEERSMVLCLDTDWEMIAEHETTNLLCQTLPSHLAYMIYTSGSTGRPKGVLITHANLVHSTLARFVSYDEPVRDYLLLSPFFFDSSVAGLYWTFCQGGRLVLPAEDFRADLLHLPQLIMQQHISHLLSIPSLYALILNEAPPEQLASLRTVIVAGETCPVSLVQRHQEIIPHVELYNEYGPTEGTVWSSVYRCQFEPHETAVPIGRPIPNVQLYLLDQGLRLVPMGVVGEVYIGGEGLARGYAGRSDLTAEKFVANPFAQEEGQRLYRTGDLARYRTDGALEYLGRRDQQVKIRGYRIELGEIEAVLRAHPQVGECVVTVMGEKQLVAYVVAVPQKSLAVQDVHKYMQERVPSYMVPTQIVLLEALPLTTNGKIDRKALPAPNQAYAQEDALFLAPRTPIEKELAALWAEILGVKRVGIRDNFFELGGDSIISIQVIARARQRGLHIALRQLFQYPTIEELSFIVNGDTLVQAEQGLVLGAVPLTPIQHWFFERNLPEPHYFNQALLLEASQSINALWLQQAFAHLLHHHDALRLRFVYQDEHWQQELAGIPTQPFLFHIDLSVLPIEQQQAAMAQQIELAQSSLNLTAGLLLRALLFTRGSNQPDRLLIIIHHLAVDGVSWRILLKDLEVLYGQLAREEPLQLAAKTTSWQQWSRLLGQYAQSERVQSERSYWLAPQRQQMQPLPVDMHYTDNTIEAMTSVNVSLSAQLTQALLQEVPAVYHTQINEVLLTALVQAFANWTKQPRLLVDLESHGREELSDEQDLSRTVGWFTSQFPMLLDIEHVTGPGTALKAVKEQVRQVPQKGLGFWLLRYMQQDAQLAEQFARLPQADVVFNYLGQFDASFREQSLFHPAAESTGPTHSRLQARSHLLGINGMVVGGQLHITWQYNQRIHHKETIQALAQRFISCLTELIVHCQEPEAGGFTSADFPLAHLNQQQLDKLLAHTSSVQAERPEQQIEDIYPLSPMQEGLLFQSLYAPETGIYCVQFGWTIQGQLDTDAWQRAWQYIIKRHAILRTLFAWQGLDEPLQVVYKQVALPYEMLDWRSLSAPEQQQHMAALQQAKELKSYDLEHAPLLRLVLVHLEEEVSYFHLSVHHMISDGWSQSLLLQEMQQCYQAFSQGREPGLPAVRHYRDYIAWLQQRDIYQTEQFWRTYLAGFTAPNQLPGQNEVASASDMRMAMQQLQCSSLLASSLQERAQQLQLTLNTLLQGAWALLLSHYSGERDIIFGATTTGRPPELSGVETMVGVFINTLPVRTRIVSTMLLSEWLRQLQQDQGDARQYEYTPLAQIQSWSEVPPGQTLFESLLIFQNYPVATSALEHSGEVAFQRSSTVERTHYPLLVKILPAKAALTIQLQYNEARFESATVSHMLQQLQILLQTIVDLPQQRLGELSLLSPVERQQLLIEWNNTAVPYPEHMSVHQLFEQQVERTPDGIALVFEEHTLSYAELNRRANQLAHYLQQRGVGPEVLVGICMERSLEMVIGMLAVFKAGGAYVPLDPVYPAERLAFMLADAQVGIVLVQQPREASGAVTAEFQTIDLDTDWPTIAVESPENLVGEIAATNLAYVIYTSGSTGRPKGTMITHGNLINFLSAMDLTLAEQIPGVWLAVTSISFDISVLELFWTLARGFRVVVHPSQHLAVNQDGQTGNARTDESIPAQINRLGITHLQCTPSQAMLFLHEPEVQSALHSLQKLLLGGEALPFALFKQLSEMVAGTIYNMYGPTETTIWSTTQMVEQETSAITIGKPIANTQVYILDEQGHVQPRGLAGELFIGGDGVTRGYLRQPALSAEKFLPDPWSQKEGARLYRTGDVVRYRSDGQIEYLGRGDHQVKLRGHRIELGEIEVALRAHPTIQNVVALVREDQPGDKRLVAYVVVQPGQARSESTLRSYLQDRLPAYLIPSWFVFLDALPLTPNGKLDRRMLPLPEQIQETPDTAGEEARTPLEDLLRGVWSKVLGRSQIGINENFFELGGHSLLATQLIGQVRMLFKVEVPLRALFEAPTVAGLAQHIEQLVRQGAGLTLSPLLVGERPEHLPLSFAQQRLWFLDQLEPGNTAYLLPNALRVQGTIDIDTLQRSLQELIQRHENLRTTFAEHAGQPVQIIHPAGSVLVPLIDLQGIDSERGQAQARHLARQEAQHPYDLSQGPLLRTTVLRLGQEEHVLLLTLHHIITDGWSNEVLVSELTTLYAAQIAGQPSPLAPLALQYADYALWQRQWLQGEVMEAQLAYWREQLAGIEPLALPLDHPRPALQTSHGAVLVHRVPREILEPLQRLSQQEGVTLFMLLLAVFQVLLQRYTGQRDISVGTPIANRTRAETEGMIGFFANTLVLRTDLSGNPTFEQVLQRVREVCLGAYAHQDVPFESVVEAVNPLRDLSRSPLFQVMFTLQRALFEQDVPTGIQMSTLDAGHVTSKFDLNLSVTETPHGLHASLGYNTDLFAAETIQQMLNHWDVLLRGLLQTLKVQISEVPLLTADERERLLATGNGAPTVYPDQLCLHHLFEQQVARTRDAIALEYEQEQITYEQLNRLANQLAHYLQQQGVGPDVLVGVALERSPALIISILGILKAGGAYVPLDPTFPKQRLVSFVEEAHLSILLTNSSLRETFSTVEQVVCLDDVWSAVLNYDGEKPPTSTTRVENLAYVLYTSGSTGQPKGVMIPHQGVVHFVDWCSKHCGVDSGSGSPVHTSLSFDLTITSLFPILVIGRRVVLVPDAPGVESLSQIVQMKRGFSVLKITPTHFDLLRQTLPPERFAEVANVLVIGGEALQSESVSAWLEHAPATRIINEYGPTETVVGCCIYEIPQDEKLVGVIPIGRPLPNTQLYVLDAHLHPVPLGVAGELYIGGVGVGRGYLNRSDLTAERFIANPFSTEPGARMYRSGDSVRRLLNGTLAYLGRIDQQVKLRGYRIEMGEIEAVLSQHPAVEGCVVQIREDVPGEKTLVAYPVSNSEHPPTLKELRSYLRDRLPSYMIPAAFVVLDALPLTLNGKVDHRKLPPPQEQPGATQTAQEESGTQIEELLIGIWSTVLGRAQIGRHENFFELGGHSLLATRLVARVNALLGIDISVLTVFEEPTIAGFAQRVEQAVRGGSMGADIPPLVARGRVMEMPLSFAQQRLWFLDQLYPGSTAYIVPSAHYLPGPLKVEALEHSLKAIIERHESLRTTFTVESGQPMQVIHPAGNNNLPLIDLCGLAYEQRKHETQQLVEQEKQLPCDLVQGPLLRTSLVRLEDEVHVLLLTLHHIVTDGWSNRLLLQEFIALYHAFAHGQPSPLGPLPLQYVDYALWQHDWLRGEVLEAQLAYWTRRLAGAPPIELPTDYPRPASASSRGAVHPFTLSPELSQSLLLQARQEGVTTFVLLLAVFQILFYRFTGQTDVVVGTDSANRRLLETEKIVGFFVNLLALRTDMSGKPTFRTVLQRVREVVVGAYAHQDTPFELLVEKLAPDHYLDRSPIVQTLFVLQNIPLQIEQSIELDQQVSHSAVNPLSHASMLDRETLVKFDLALFMSEQDGKLVGALNYRLDLFKESTIATMVARFIALLQSCVNQPDMPIDFLNMVLEERETPSTQEKRTKRKALNIHDDGLFAFPEDLYPLG